MKTLKVAIENSDFEKYGLNADSISFDALKEKITIQVARESLLLCTEIARQNGFDTMSDSEIEKEIIAVRNAKSRN